MEHVLWWQSQKMNVPPTLHHTHFNAYPKAVAYLENRQGGSNPKRAHLVTLRAPGRKGATGAHGGTGRLHETFEGIFADLFVTTLDECFADPS